MEKPKKDSEEPDKPKIMSHRTAMRVVTVALILAAFGVAGYFYNQYRQVQSKIAKPGQSAEEEVKSVVSAVSKLMLLPEGEEPTVATVSDIEKLREQAFFTKAQNGDKVLIYNTAKKAILYRPADNRIIEVAPVNITQNQATGSAQGPTPAPVRIAIYNGTTRTGLTRTYESELTAKLPGSTIVARENAAKNDYAKTIISAVDSASSTRAQELAVTLGIVQAPLPQGEEKPTGADFLIILGSDKVPGASATPTATPVD